MILFRRTPFQCKMKNVMMLDVELKKSIEENDVDDESVVYVSKNTYDQCVRMHGRFEGEIGYMCRNLGVEYGEGTPVDYFYNNAPEPINILAPFIGVLVKAGHKVDEIEDMFGYLHIMSQIINFDSYMLMQADARADVTIGNAVLKSYKESWEDLESSLMERVPQGLYVGNTQMVPMGYGTAPTNVQPNGYQVATVQNASDEGVDLHDAAAPEEDSESEDDFIAQMNALLAQAEKEAKEELAEKAKEETPKAPIVTEQSDADAREQEYKEENDKIADAFAKYIGH